MTVKKDSCCRCRGLYRAHRKGVEVVDSMYKVSVEPADAVIVSCGGFPKDINLFQANKALDNATQAVKAGGSIILVAECAEGIGNQVYECWNRECRSPDDAIERFKKNVLNSGGTRRQSLQKLQKDLSFIWFQNFQTSKQEMHSLLLW
ncbi:hypothetical protein [Methanosarcina barkeri]